MTKQELLTAGVLLDDQDLSWLDVNEWFITKKGVRASVDGTIVNLPRLIMSAPPNLVVDHINRNVLDNRRSNLRLCSGGQNACNQGLKNNNWSGYKGVIYNSGGWEARIGFKGKKEYLGFFKTPREAAEAYNKRAKELHGDYARLNEL